MLSEKPWKPDAVILFLTAWLASICFGGLLAAWISSDYSPIAVDLRVASLVIASLSFHGVPLLMMNSFLRQHETSWAAGFGWLSPRRGRALLLAVIVGLCALPIVWSLGHLSAKAMESFHLAPELQESVQMLQASTSFGMTALIGVLAVVVAPVAEELVFRGILYPTVKQYGFPHLAFWGTSLLFAVVHNNAMSFLPLTFLAVILTLLYETTDNLLAPIVTHSLFNLANFVSLIYGPSVH